MFYSTLCKRKRRSDSIMGATMIEKYIDDYEKEHDEIILTSSKEICNDQTELMKNNKNTIKK